MSAYLLDLARARKLGASRSVTSVCSSNPYVLEAALGLHRDKGKVALIEATCNQVNQYGGYTGMSPADFAQLVHRIADRLGYPLERLLLGGDHLGPYPWRQESYDNAMAKACALITAYVKAGYSKIHLDASMPLGGDSTDAHGALDIGTSSERTAQLCVAAERAREPGTEPPVYVIGSEVPAPGGASAEDHAPDVTEVPALLETVERTREAFYRHNVGTAWERVIAVVVQPGVEFSDQHVYSYDRAKARQLCLALHNLEHLVFEGHSTDYQRPEQLREMAEDGVLILKVGPALTFAFREAVYLLGHVEQEMASVHTSMRTTRLQEVLARAMMEKPKHWIGYHAEDDQCLGLNLKYGMLDRCRYYWSVPEVDRALTVLLQNVKSAWPPLPLLRQFFPNQYWKVRRGCLSNDPLSFIHDRIQETLRTYPDLR